MRDILGWWIYFNSITLWKNKGNINEILQQIKKANNNWMYTKCSKMNAGVVFHFEYSTILECHQEKSKSTQTADTYWKGRNLNASPDFQL